MGIKILKPTSPARRYMTLLTGEEITRKGPEKSLLRPKRRTDGRNAYRRITPPTPPRGGEGGAHPRTPAPQAATLPGNALPIRNIPLGTMVHNLELEPGKGAQLCRSAGSQAQLLAKEGDHAQVKLPSGEIRMVRLNCMATVGQVGNLDHENISIGKAGRVRWRGFRPTVRGTAMNPVDHPMGGGEGRGKGNHPMTPWGKPTKGYKTRKAGLSDRYIVARRKK